MENLLYWIFTCGAHNSAPLLFVHQLNILLMFVLKNPGHLISHASGIKIIEAYVTEKTVSMAECSNPFQVKRQYQQVQNLVGTSILNCHQDSCDL